MYCSGETGIELNGGLLSKESIVYADITAVRWEDIFERGSRNFGTSTFTVSTGIYQNSAGSYFLCIWKSVLACIVVEHAGKRSAFNAQTEAETRALYEALLEKTAAV